MNWLCHLQLRPGMTLIGFETENRYYFVPSGTLKVIKVDSKNVYVRHPHGDIEALPLTARFLFDKERCRK